MLFHLVCSSGYDYLLTFAFYWPRPVAAFRAWLHTLSILAGISFCCNGSFSFDSFAFGDFDIFSVLISAVFAEHLQIRQWSDALIISLAPHTFRPRFPTDFFGVSALILQSETHDFETTVAQTRRQFPAGNHCSARHAQWGVTGRMHCCSPFLLAHLARSSLSITKRTERDCVQSKEDWGRVTSSLRAGSPLDVGFCGRSQRRAYSQARWL